MTPADRLKGEIRDVPDFPRPGILFKDITPILLDPELFRQAVGLFIDRHRADPPSKVAGIEARGFILGSALACQLGAGFVPIRKAGKLPSRTLREAYDLEYGEAALEVHVDAVSPGDRVLVIDDLLATGGTAAAAVSLIRQLGGDVTEVDVLVELAFLDGRTRLQDVPVFAPIVF